MNTSMVPVVALGALWASSAPFALAAQPEIDIEWVRAWQ